MVVKGSENAIITPDNMTELPISARSLDYHLVGYSSGELASLINSIRVSSILPPTTIPPQQNH